MIISQLISVEFRVRDKVNACLCRFLRFPPFQIICYLSIDFFVYLLMRNSTFSSYLYFFLSNRGSKTNTMSPNTNEFDITNNLHYFLNNIM